MKHSSQTGLLSTVTKQVERRKKNVSPVLEVEVKHAPYTTKPFTGLFNPFARGCSILCNHPVVPDVKRLLQKAKGRVGEEGKSVILPAEIAAIRAELEEFQLKTQVVFIKSEPSNQIAEHPDISEIVPEELFRKYTETDSRPLTPTPTLESVHTRASATRKCITPDPIITSEIKEKTLLVLDLRRSHSQETLSCYGGSASQNEMPLIRIMNVSLTPASSRRNLLVEKRQQQMIPSTKNVSKCVVSQSDEMSRLQLTNSSLHVPVVCNNQNYPNSDNAEECMKRRGRKRKKRRASSNVSIFRTPTDPETLIAAVTPDSKNPSARHSLNEQHAEDLTKFIQEKLESVRSFNIDSFLDYECLRQLRRALTADVVDMEFDETRKLALNEALKTISNTTTDCEELREIHKNANVPQIDSEFRFGLPQKFSRRNVRIELPMDSRAFNRMTPMEFINKYVYVSNARKLLYVFLFNIHRKSSIPENFERDIQTEEFTTDSKQIKELNKNRNVSINQEDIKEISGADIICALGVLMGKALTETQGTGLHSLIGWSFDESYNFRTFSAICAICERLYAIEFYPNLPGREEDPCHLIEMIDFESLEKKIRDKIMDQQLLQLLHKLKVA